MVSLLKTLQQNQFVILEVSKLTELSQEEIKKLPPLEQAKLDLLSLYTMNSMAWVYNTVNGVDPKQTALKDELQRVQVSMKKAQGKKKLGKGKERHWRAFYSEIEDKKKRLRVDSQAAKRVVAHEIKEYGKKKKENNKKKK